MAMVKKPLTMLLVLCCIMVCIAVVAGVVCHSDDKCWRKFQFPIQALGCMGCLLVLFALFLVESQGHSGGVSSYGR